MNSYISKTILAVLCVCTVLPTLAACGNNSGEQITAATTTDAVATTTSAIDPDPTTPVEISLEGKNIVWLGSSVTYGSATGGVSMADYLADVSGCNSYKYAVSGTTLVDNGPDSYVQRMKGIRKSQKCDYFICQLSTNDATQNKPLGAISDSFDMEDFNTTTIYGAIEYIIAYAKDRWDCPVAFYTNPQYSSDNYKKMVNALLEIQEKWGIYVLDLWNDEELNDMTRREHSEFWGKYMADDIHPNAAGYKEWWTPIFEEFIKSTI